MCVVCLSDVPVLNGLLNRTQTMERQGETMLTQVLIVHLRLEISDVRVHITDRNNDFSSVLSVMDIIDIIIFS